jgi:hypothetical protein
MLAVTMSVQHSLQVVFTITLIVFKKIVFDFGSHYFAQAGLELLGSNYPPGWTTGICLCHKVVITTHLLQ